MATIRIVTDYTYAKIYFDYDKAIVDAVKTIPGRGYVDAGAGGKYWRVPRQQADAARNLLASLGHNVIVVSEHAATDEPLTVTRLRNEAAMLRARIHILLQEVQRLRQEKAAHDANWAESLLSKCPPELGDRVFRALTKALHPDTGGDTVLMRDLNVARDRLREPAGHRR